MSHNLPGLNGSHNPGRVVNLCFFIVLIFATLLTWREIVVLEASWVTSQRNAIEDLAHQIEGDLQMSTGQLLFYRRGMQAALNQPVGGEALLHAAQAYQRQRAQAQWSIYLNNQRTLRVFGVSDALVERTPLLSRDSPREDAELLAALEGGYLLRLAGTYSRTPHRYYYVSRAGFYLTSDPAPPGSAIVQQYLALIDAPWFLAQTGRRNPARGIRWSSWLVETPAGPVRQIAASLPLDYEQYWYGVLSMIFTPPQLAQILKEAVEGKSEGEYRLYDAGMHLIAGLSAQDGSAADFNAVEKAQLARALELDTRGGMRFGTRYVSWQKLKNFDGAVVRIHPLREGVRSDFGEMSVVLGLLWLMFTSLLLLSWIVIRRMVRNMSDLHSSLQWQAWYDGLTAVYNRNTLFAMAARAAEQCQQQGTPLALIQLDLDHFKQINDSWGHQAGDRVLNQVAAIMAKKVREGDLVGRVGGEEFCIVLPDTSLEEACAVAERIRRRINAREILLGGNKALRVSASLGVSASDEQGVYGIEHLQSIADKRLYRAKQLGRNRACCCDTVE